MIGLLGASLAPVENLKDKEIFKIWENIIFNISTK